jgi:hypothetical protein
VSSGATTVDFVARGATSGQWQMVLVESGPWEDLEPNLRRIQERLYGCLDAALDGKLAERFPESLGKEVVIRLDCYNVPRDEVLAFFDRFSHGVVALADYKHALGPGKFVKRISFEVTFDSIH